MFESSAPCDVASMHSDARPYDEVVAKLSGDRYPGLLKTLAFEVGEAYHAVLEDKLSVERPPLCFAATARKSAAGYKAFVAAYNDREGKPPAQVEADEERTYLTARYGPAVTANLVIQRI